MAIEITMPRLSDTMEEGTLLKWHVNPGDEVQSGDTLADVETDKATMEMQAFEDGRVARLALEPGQVAQVGTVIAVLAESGEEIDKAAAEVPAQAAAAEEASSGGAEAAEAEEASPEPAAEPAAAPAASEAKAPAAPVSAAEEPEPPDGVRVSPVAKKLAAQHGVDLASVTGSGPDGRIVKKDVLRAAESAEESVARGRKPAPAEEPGAAPAAPAPSASPAAASEAPPEPAQLEEKRVALSGMRKTIGRRLLESTTTIPHFTVTMTVEVDALLALRKTLNEQLAKQGIKLSVNDFVMRATALSLTQHPHVNASWGDDHIQLHGRANLGLAVALPEERGGGLVVPVIGDADRKGIRQISQESRSLAEKARGRGLSEEEMSGGTFTVSNLGMFGVDHFTAIINPPQAAILAVGGAHEEAASENGQLVTRSRMRCTLSADHRVVDGAMAAAFLQTLKQMLESPAAVLV